MVDYRDPDDASYFLRVATDDPKEVFFYMMEDGKHPDDNTSSGIDRDAVAALVGQLTSWLARTAEARP